MDKKMKVTIEWMKSVTVRVVVPEDSSDKEILELALEEAPSLEKWDDVESGPKIYDTEEE